MIDLARRVSEQHFGHRRIGPLARGRWSSAYRTGGVPPHHVIRIGDAGRCLPGYERDLWAGKWWSTTGLVPNVVATGTVDGPSGSDVAYCISEFHGGAALEKSPGVTAEILAELLARLDQLELPGTRFGPWLGQNASANHATWVNWLSASAQQSASVISRARFASNDTIHQWLHELSRRLVDLPNRRGVVHRDLGAGNVLVDRSECGGAVTAQGHRLTVIDWGNSVAGDPFYDAAHLVFWDPWHPLLHQAVESLRLARDGRIGAYSIHIGLEQLAFHATAHPNARQSRQVIARINSVLGRK